MFLQPLALMTFQKVLNFCNMGIFWNFIFISTSPYSKPHYVGVSIRWLAWTPMSQPFRLCPYIEHYSQFTVYQWVGDVKNFNNLFQNAMDLPLLLRENAFLQFCVFLLFCSPRSASSYWFEIHALDGYLHTRKLSTSIKPLNPKYISHISMSALSLHEFAFLFHES